MSDRAQLQPSAVWKIFGAMSEIPRCSGNEAAVQSMFRRWAEERSLPVKEDAVGNLLITIPASPGHEGAEPLLIQGHVDMVCEKNAATKHDFQKDPIRLRVDGDWVAAEGTTLGADNGIGVAMGLALADDPDAVHGPVEVLLTVDEERGLTGASGIEPGFFTAKRMINLDSEEDDAIFVGCAGGRDTVLTMPLARGRAPRDPVGRQVAVTGLRGGHSGLDIHLGRGNAIKLLARALAAAAAELDVRLVSFDGGSMRNAIPREATARVLIARRDGRAFKKLVDETLAGIQREELTGSDEGLAWKVSSFQAGPCFRRDDGRRALDLLLALPNGVQGMSRSLEGLVETSTNVGVARTESDGLRIVCCSRSSVMSALAALVEQHRAVGVLAGARVEQPEGYPGWQPNLDAHLLAVTREQYRRIFGSEAELKAIHAGLECGLLTVTTPGLEIVSFGPNIRGAHSPDERVQISSVEKIWKLLKGVTAELA
ncbi:MAG: aminoacyl-histidine dipeptidase [Candidatus Krumholzibacteriia bacterium]